VRLNGKRSLRLYQACVTNEIGSSHPLSDCAANRLIKGSVPLQDSPQKSPAWRATKR